MNYSSLGINYGSNRAFIYWQLWQQVDRLSFCGVRRSAPLAGGREKIPKQKLMTCITSYCQNNFYLEKVMYSLDWGRGMHPSLDSKMFLKNAIFHEVVAFFLGKNSTLCFYRAKDRVIRGSRLVTTLNFSLKCSECSCHYEHAFMVFSWGHVVFR